MHNNKIWLHKDVSIDAAAQLSKSLGISTLLAKVLISRGFESVDSIEKFLNPSISELHDPFLLDDMEKAVARIIYALNNGEKILIYGDYDVDGITSTSILYKFIKSQKGAVDFYIPDRLDEGYGLSNAAIDKILINKPSLIITVDCGVTAIDEVNFLNMNHIDVIITDHHECQEILPAAYAVVNPCRKGSKYPFKELAGVGVTYKLITALCNNLRLQNTHSGYLDIVALGTIADVVPLVDENRAIVKAGLENIKNTDNIGLKALIEKSIAEDKPINSFSVSFILAPRINAAGRIGAARRAVDLLITDSTYEASNLADMLNDENKNRQAMEQEILAQVIDIIDTEIDIAKTKVIIVSGENWHHGVIGIVCSKIIEKYHRPCILFTNEDGLCKGSGRSIEGFNIFNALCHCSGLLEKFGGHQLAAGLTIKYDNLPEFRNMINDYANKHLSQYDLLPKLHIDAIVDKSEITIETIKELDLLAPFGAGNLSPVFSCSNYLINEIRTVGENKHLKMKLEGENSITDAIAFGMGSLTNNYFNNDRIDVAFSPEINLWQSNEKVQLNIKDLRLTKEQYMEREYLKSLGNCITESFENIALSSADNLKIQYRKDNIIENLISESLFEKKRLIILVNSIKSLFIIDEIINNYSKDIKNEQNICYTCFDEEVNALIQVIVNPKLDLVDFTRFDRVVVFGQWIDKYYLDCLLNRIGLDKTIFITGNEYRADLDIVVPDRKELASVYQYLRLNNGLKLHDYDLEYLTKVITEKYRIKMNCFKLKKSIEIFKELKLVEVNTINEEYFQINITENGENKKNLNDSTIYKKLQSLKNQSVS